ncbi:peptidase C14, partial [Mesorhizobium sp. M7A.F.Ca.CA.004.05.1.1]
DGTGQNSPFTTALTKYLGTDGLEIRSVLTLVQQEVYDLSRGKQLPYVESGLPKLFFAAAAKQQLPERERLLLAMADVTPEMRGEVEQVASDADMPLAPLYGVLISSDASHLSADSLNARLREAADAFVKVRGEMRTLASDDPQVTELRRQAEEQLSLGAFDGARAILAKAADIDNVSRNALKANFVNRTLSEA